MDAVWCAKALGAAEGSCFGTTDLRYIATKASPNSGISFGISQLDATQAGKPAFKAVVEIARVSKALTDSVALALVERYCGTKARDEPTTAEYATLKTLFASATARSIIDKEDSKRVLEMSSVIDKMMLTSANGWLTRTPSVPCPVLVDNTLTGFKTIYAYAMATLNKRPDNYDTLVSFLSGQRTITKSATFPAAKKPPSPNDFHEFQSGLVCWTGANGSYKNLKSRMAFIGL